MLSPGLLPKLRTDESERISELIIAVDDERVAEPYRKASLRYEITSPKHGTSTERVTEVARKVTAVLYIVVNGDEPLIDAAVVENIIPDSWENDVPYAAKLACITADPSAVVDPTNIEVGMRPDRNAIFFSRSPIPFPKGNLDFKYYKHVGVLAYNLLALEFFCRTPRGEVEEGLQPVPLSVDVSQLFSETRL